MNHSKSTPFHSSLRLWTGIVAPPPIMLFSQWIDYSLVSWACATGRTFVLHIAPVVALLLVAGTGYAAWSEFQPAPAETASPGGQMAARARFMARLGLWTSILFALILVALWIPNFILNPCQQ